MLVDSGGQEFGQDRVRMGACVCSAMSGSQLEALKAAGWDLLKAPSLTRQVVDAGC